MRRRSFLAAATAAVATAATLGTPQPAVAQSAAGNQQWIEIRTYHFASADKQQAYAAFLAKAGIPAMKRAGAAGPIGVLKLNKADNPRLADLKEDSTDLWVIIPHASGEAFMAFESKLAADTGYQEAGKGLLDTPKSDPAFTRYESMLLIAFAGMPQAKAPAELVPDRVLELRTYQGHNEERAANKVGMFNDGEIPIFAKVGMPPVFFGKGIAGPDLPHLTYMIWHKSLDESKKNWDRFRTDPDWAKIKDLPKYKDNVSKIVNRFFRPAEGSEI